MMQFFGDNGEVDHPSQKDAASLHHPTHMAQVANEGQYVSLCTGAPSLPLVDQAFESFHFVLRQLEDALQGFMTIPMKGRHEEGALHLVTSNREVKLRAKLQGDLKGVAALIIPYN